MLGSEVFEMSDLEKRSYDALVGPCGGAKAKQVIESWRTSGFVAVQTDQRFLLQAIVTKYVCATNHRGSRVKATAAAGSVTLAWDNALNPEQNHRAAAVALAAKYGWDWPLFGGGMPNDSGYCFVQIA